MNFKRDGDIFVPWKRVVEEEAEPNVEGEGSDELKADCNGYPRDVYRPERPCRARFQISGVSV